MNIQKTSKSEQFESANWSVGPHPTHCNMVSVACHFKDDDIMKIVMSKPEAKQFAKLLLAYVKE